LRNLSYDPVKRHLLLEKLLTRIEDGQVEKRYWRFRADRWYGGIATADCVGCGLTCKFCWVQEKVLYSPASVGAFYRPQDVASRLKSTAAAKGFGQARVSGGEPTIGREHLLQLLAYLGVHQPLDFILETNGILIGHDRSYARDLAQFDFLEVRVSLKGCCAVDFESLTGASPEGFELQLGALRHLVDEGVRCHAAVMRSFSSRESFRNLVERLSSIDAGLAGSLEIEDVIMYPRVARKIGRFGLRPVVSYRPDEVPADLV